MVTALQGSDLCFPGTARGTRRRAALLLASGPPRGADERDAARVAHVLQQSGTERRWVGGGMEGGQG